jgi:hypothetical protein
MYSPLGAVSKMSSKWLAWLTRKPWAIRTAPSESVTARRSSPERSCARAGGETSRRRRTALIETRRRWILRGRRGNASGLFYSAGGRRLLDGSATTFGRERRCCSDMSSLLECCRFGLRILGNGDRVGDEAELRSAWTGEAPVPTWPVPTQAGANLGSVMGVTVFCEIRIPVPGLGGRGANDGNAVRAGKTATVRICTPTSRRCKWKIQGEGSLCASRWSVPGMWGW